MTHSRPVQVTVCLLSPVDKLGARGISSDDARQLPRNAHVVMANPRAGGESDARRLLVGLTDGGRAVSLVIERTSIQARG